MISACPHRHSTSCMFVHAPDSLYQPPASPLDKLDLESLTSEVTQSSRNVVQDSWLEVGNERVERREEEETMNALIKDVAVTGVKTALIACCWALEQTC